MATDFYQLRLPSRPRLGYSKPTSTRIRIQKVKSQAAQPLLTGEGWGTREVPLCVSQRKGSCYARGRKENAKPLVEKQYQYLCFMH